ncbi:MAG TPA: ABC transporter substrate-binding protein [Telmatospirillum sp.]|nr:ABC transporter substrate-binding protein [Telmatospirillum sp.]
MNRRRLLRTLAGCTATALLPHAAVAMTSRRFRIAMILWRGETAIEWGFRQQLAELGLAVDYEVHDLAQDFARLPSILAEIKRTRPDLVYTWGTGITLQTVGSWNAVDPSRHIVDIPVVFAPVGSPQGSGLQPPPGAPPRPNVTGVSHIAPLSAQINAMRAYFKLQRLGIVYNPSEENSVVNVEQLRASAAPMAFELLEAPVPMTADGAPDPAAIPRLVADLARRGAQMLYIGPDNFIGANRTILADSGIRAGIPCFTATELEIRDGQAMIGLVSRYEAVGRLAATKAKRILVDGDSPSVVPIETLKHFSYIIRLPVALKLKLYPPLPLLDYAEVIR